MRKITPAIIFSLDKFASDLCHGIMQRLQQDYEIAAHLVQTYTITNSNETLTLDVEPEPMASSSFDLDIERSQYLSKRLPDQEAISSLEVPLINILKARRYSDDLERLQHLGIETTSSAVIYLMISAFDVISGETAISVARLLRWLCSTYFTQETYKINIVVLLPSMFLNAQQTDYANAYAVLKQLDCYAASDIIAPKQKMPFLDGCWLVDGINSNGMEIGLLTDNLPSYCDAFIGFLTTSPERSDILSNALTIRGKPSIYSSFGFCELVFPAQILMERFATALAQDIIRYAYLPEQNSDPNRCRRLMLISQQIILNKDFTSELTNIDRYQGRQIWRKFDSQLDIRTVTVNEYISELHHRHQQFEQEFLTQFKHALLLASEAVQSKFTSLLDREIIKYIDATSDGLSQTLELLQMLIAPKSPEQGDILGEDLQNIVSVKYIEINKLNQLLGISVENISTTQFESIQKTRDEKSQVIIDTEVELKDSKHQLDVAVRHLENLQQERLRFLNCHLIFYPFLATTSIIFIILFLALINTNLVAKILEIVLLNFISSVLILGLLVIIYLAIVIYKYIQDIQRKIHLAQQKINQCKRNFNVAIVKLCDAHNNKLRFDYDLYAQNLRIEVLTQIIEMIEQKIALICECMKQLDEIQNNFTIKHQMAIPHSTKMSRSLLSLAEMDVYYENYIGDIKVIVDQFLQNCVKRSHLLSITTQDFSNKLNDFTRKYFQKLVDLSIEDVLLNQPDLISPDTVIKRLSETILAASPLLRLQDSDSINSLIAEQELGLWINKDNKQLSSLCRQVFPDINVYFSSSSSQKLSVLARCLNFPAYQIGNLLYYQACYEREPQKHSGNLPELIPIEFAISSKVKTVYENLLIAISMGIVLEDTDKNYVFTKEKIFLGKDRTQIAEHLANNINSQNLYTAICECIEKCIGENREVYESLKEFQSSSNNFNNHEQELLDILIRRYHPLN